MVPHESRGMTRNDVQASTRPSLRIIKGKGVGHARLLEILDRLEGSLEEPDARSSKARRGSGEMALPNLFWRNVEVVFYSRLAMIVSIGKGGVTRTGISICG